MKAGTELSHLSPSLKSAFQDAFRLTSFTINSGNTRVSERIPYKANGDIDKALAMTPLLLVM
jgi:hypothetical protein